MVLWLISKFWTYTMFHILTLRVLTDSIIKHESSKSLYRNTWTLKFKKVTIQPSSMLEQPSLSSSSSKISMDLKLMDLEFSGYQTMPCTATTILDISLVATFWRCERGQETAAWWQWAKLWVDKLPKVWVAPPSKIYQHNPMQISSCIKIQVRSKALNPKTYHLQKWQHYHQSLISTASQT